MEKEKTSDGKKVGANLIGLANKVGNVAVDVANKSKDLAVNSKDTIVDAIDQNGNGEVDIEDVIIMGLKVPGIKINRSDFLRAYFGSSVCRFRLKRCEHFASTV